MTRKQMHELVHAWIEALKSARPAGVLTRISRSGQSRHGRDMALLGREAIVESLATYVAASPIPVGRQPLGIDPRA